MPAAFRSACASAKSRSFCSARALLLVIRTRSLLAREEEIEEQAEKLESSLRDNAELCRRLEANESWDRLVVALVSMTFAVLIWIFRFPLAGAIAAKIGVRQAVDLGLTALAAFLFCFPNLRFVRKADWRPEVKVCIGALLIGVAIWTTKVIAPALATDVASYLAIATTIAGISVFSGSPCRSTVGALRRKPA